MQKSKTQQDYGLWIMQGEALRAYMLRHRKSEADILKDDTVNVRTLRKIFRGGAVRWGTVEAVLNVLGIEDFGPYAVPQVVTGQDRSSELGEWSVEQALTPVITATNGLQYRVFRLKHRHQPERLGRGKRYEFLHLSDDAQAALRELLIRHPKVCDRVGPHPQISVCYGTFPESEANAWWVVDRWQEGRSLREILTSEKPLMVETLRRLARETAAGLSVLHKAGIIRRELSPDGILLRDADGQVVLTDFELAKLLDGSPSVSRDWPPNPYRAPEVCEAGMNEQADIFSWGRVVIHAALGNLPACGAEAEALAKCKLPAGIRALLISCVKLRKSQRPVSMSDVLSVVDRWK